MRSTERRLSTNRLVPYIWAAGIIQWVIAAANLFVPAKLGYGENLVKVTNIVRQIFIVHAVYIVGVLIGLGALSLWFAPELASGPGLGRFLSSLMAAFWLPRVVVQWGYYDDRVKKQHRLAHYFFSFLFVYLGTVFALAAWRVIP